MNKQNAKALRAAGVADGTCARMRLQYRDGSGALLATKFGGRGVDMGYGPAAGAKGGRDYIRRAVAGSLASSADCARCRRSSRPKGTT